MCQVFHFLQRYASSERVKHIDEVCDIVQSYEQPGDTSNVHFDRLIKFATGIRHDRLDIVTFYLELPVHIN